MEITLIGAVADNRVIGNDGEMPWHLPEDLAHFKRKTTGHPVIMGRTTYESIVAQLEEPLSNRLNIVLTTRPLDTSADNVYATDSIGDAMDRAAEFLASEAALLDAEDTAYVIGGESVYGQFLSMADRLVLTEIEEAYEGDTYFPEWKDESWREVTRDERDWFAFVEYERKNDDEE